MKKSVYIASIEVKPLEGCSILDPKEIKGAFVRCYLLESNKREAMSEIKRSMVDAKFDVIGIDWCYDAEETEWENPDHEHNELISEAYDSEYICLGTFHTWNH